MFLKLSIFKKLLKVAYTEGTLQMCRLDDTYIIHSNYWVVKIDVRRFNNKARAALVELTGMLPEEGEAFLVTGKNSAQRMIAASPWIKVLNEKLGIKEIYVTKVIIHSKIPLRILQDQDNGIFAVQELFIEMISNDYLESNENEVAGPYLYFVNPEKSMSVPAIMWQNETCTFMAAPFDLKDDERVMDLKEHLESIALPTETF